jgi:hypothetical protein
MTTTRPSTFSDFLTGPYTELGLDLGQGTALNTVPSTSSGDDGVMDVRHDVESGGAAKDWGMDHGFDDFLDLGLCEVGSSMIDGRSSSFTPVKQADRVCFFFILVG